jgi:hypothetical protein
MLPLIILGLLLFLLRSSGAVVFLALCAGIVLLKYVGADSSVLLSSFWPRSSVVSQEALNIILVLLPVASTTILLRKSVSGTKIFLNLLPAISVGCLVALSVVPLLSPITSRNVMHTWGWSGLIQFQDFIVGTGVLVSLLLMKSSHKKATGHKKSHH